MDCQTGQLYQKRRNSYSAAISNVEIPTEDGSIESCETSSCLVQHQASRLPDNLSLEYECYSSESYGPRREISRTLSAETSGCSGEMEVAEILVAHPETLRRLGRCQCFLAANLAISGECQCYCQCYCQCRCSQCQYRRRKISWCSVSGQQRRKDSAYSVSTCQSSLPPSSGRNSLVSLFRGIDTKEDRADIHEVIAELIHHSSRHSTQTQPPSYTCKIEEDDTNRFSEGTDLPATFESSRKITRLPDRNALKPLIARGGSLTFLPETMSTLRAAKRSWPSRKNSSCRECLRKAQLDLTTNLTSTPDSHPAGSENPPKRNSLPITRKMMKRRFSEQLILEAGLGSLPDPEDIIEEQGEPEDEESHTAINARKRVRLKKHYYPEGGWGHVIVLASILVHLISQGVVLASAVLLPSILSRFHQSPGNAGTSCYNPA